MMKQCVILLCIINLVGGCNQTYKRNLKSVYKEKDLKSVKMIQDDDQMNKKCDTCLALTKDKLSSLVDHYQFLIDNDNVLKEEDYITIVRLYNTLTINNSYLKKNKYSKFYKTVQYKAFNNIIEKLNLVLTKGMCYYSKAHKLFFGCKPDDNSHYQLIE